MSSDVGPSPDTGSIHDTWSSHIPESGSDSDVPDGDSSVCVLVIGTCPAGCFEVKGLAIDRLKVCVIPKTDVLACSSYPSALHADDCAVRGTTIYDIIGRQALEEPEYPGWRGCTASERAEWVAAFEAGACK